MKVAAMRDTTHNPFNETHWVSCLRENLTSSSYGEGLETGRAMTQVSRQSFTRQLIFKSWKSALHLAALHTKNADPPLCSLYGRRRLIVLTYALCPQMRATLWRKTKRELSVLKLVRYFQALAEEWRHAIFPSELALCRFLQRACATAERVVAKALRKRQTTAQILRESLRQQRASLAFTVAVNA